MNVSLIAAPDSVTAVLMSQAGPCDWKERMRCLGLPIPGILRMPGIGRIDADGAQSWTSIDSAGCGYQSIERNSRRAAAEEHRPIRHLSPSIAFKRLFVGKSDGKSWRAEIISQPKQWLRDLGDN